MSLESRCSSLRKHLSKSASELSCKECTGSVTSDTITPFPSPQRAKSAANPSVSTVLQRTSGFLSTLKVDNGHNLRHVGLMILSINSIDGREEEAKKEVGNHLTGQGITSSTMTVIIVIMPPTVAITAVLRRHSNHHDIEPQH